MEEELPKPPPLYLHLLVNCLPSFLAIIVSPALPSIGKYFHVSAAIAKFVVSFFLIGYAFGVLIYAPISNRFGRKPTIYLGFIIATIGTLICILSGFIHSFPLLCIGRFVEAVGATAGIQVAFTMIGDCYRPPKSLQISAYVMLSFAIGPSIGLVIGGFLTELGWLTIFYFTLAYLLLLYILVRKQVHETLKTKDLTALKPKPMIKKYLQTFRNPKAYKAAILLAFSVSFGYVFVTAAPFIVISYLKFSPEVFGLYNLMPPVGLALGCFFSSWIVKRVNPLKIVWAGICFIGVFSIAMLVFFALNDLTILTVFIPFTIILFGQALVASNTFGLCLHHLEDKSSAASILNFINLGICFLATLSLSFFDHSEYMILPIYFVVFSALMVFSGIFFQKAYTKKEGEQ